MTTALQRQGDASFSVVGEPATKASGTPGLTKRSGMVSIDLPDGLVPEVPGGVDDTQHITLAYLGKNVTDATLDDVLRTAKHVAANTEPFTITAGGVDSFPPSSGSDGKVPAFVPVTVTDELAKLREPFARYHASEHQDFKPHITLAYLDEGDPLPDPVDQVEIPVDAICVHLGDETYARIPLGYDGSSEILVKSAETAELSTVHHPLGTHGLWGDKVAQLPAYIQNIAHAMIRDGHDESEAVQMAVGAVKRWAEGGGKVTPEVRAAAAAAVAEWEKLKAEHSKTKSVVPDVVKVGPKGYIHGWIFVGVPGVGDEVRHPEHGKGKITGHDEKHVTVQFSGGKTHSFEVHRSGSESGHFTKRGDTEHAGPHAPKTAHPADALMLGKVKPKDLSDDELHAADEEFTHRSVLLGKPNRVIGHHRAVKDEIARREADKHPKEHPADRVMRDPGEIEKLSDEELEQARAGLLERHEKIGVWGDEADKMDELRSKVQRENYARSDAEWRRKDLSGAEHGPGMAGIFRKEDLQKIVQVTERKAAENGVEPDMIAGHRAARVELARRADPEPKNWTVDKLHIFGGTPKQQVRLADSMKRITSDIRPEDSAKLKHIEIKDLPKNTNGQYFFGDHHMELSARLFDRKEDDPSAPKNSEAIGWHSKSGTADPITRTTDHEFGHHLDSLMYMGGPDGMRKRSAMYKDLSTLLGDEMQNPASSISPEAHDAKLNEFVKRNAPEIINRVGTYASTNHLELVAELWAEYHGKKMNGTGDAEQFKSNQVIARYLAGHDTPFNPREYD